MREAVVLPDPADRAYTLIQKDVDVVRVHSLHHYVRRIPGQVPAFLHPAHVAVVGRAAIAGVDDDRAVELRA